MKKSAPAQIALPENGIYNLEEAAFYLRKHPETVRRWVLKKKIPCGRAGRDLRFERDALHRFMFKGRPS